MCLAERSRKGWDGKGQGFARHFEPLPAAEPKEPASRSLRGKINEEGNKEGEIEKKEAEEKTDEHETVFNKQPTQKLEQANLPAAFRYFVVAP